MRRHALILVALAALFAALAPVAGATHAKGLTVTTRTSSYGTVLFDGQGRALYAFTHDTARRSRCSGACAKAWPVAFTNGTPRAGSGVRASLLGSIKRGSRRQVTYGGRPLYSYAGDGAGEVRCQNVTEFGGVWLVVRGDGALVR